MAAVGGRTTMTSCATIIGCVDLGAPGSSGITLVVRGLPRRLVTGSNSWKQRYWPSFIRLLVAIACGRIVGRCGVGDVPKKWGGNVGLGVCMGKWWGHSAGRKNDI